MFYATCPFCSSTLQISDAQLSAKEGLVRCGHCNDIFNARNHLIKIAETSETSSLTPPVDEETDAPPVAIWENNTSNETTTRTKPYGIISIGLIMLLSLQFTVFDAELLLKEPILRPYIDQLSEQFGLGIPYYQNLDELQIVSRSLSPHRSVEKTLHLELSIKNTSKLQQQYPSIIFNLLSDTGEKVAQRRFTKQEYLTNYHKTDSFKPQAITLIELDFQRPKKAAAGFELTFSN